VGPKDKTMNDQVTGDGEPLPGVTRRQLLRLVPLLAAPAALGSILPAQARPIPPGGESGASPSPLPTVASPADVGDMPMRHAARAIRDCDTRRRQAARETKSDPTALGRILATTALWESRLGLANWMLLDEREDLNFGNFTFPISPYTVLADDGESRFLLLSNGNAIGDFREDEYLERTHRRMFDRAIWAMSQGATVIASVEFDRPLSPEKGARIFRLLAGHGVSTVIWGNEPNDPYTPWRDDIPNVFEILALSEEVRKRHGLERTDLSLPGLAYYGHGEYLEKMLRMVKDLQSQRTSGDPAKTLPVQRVTDHFYGPVDQFLPRIRQMREIMEREGVGHLKYDLTEIGNPTMGHEHKAGDERLAECYFPQVTSLAITSGLVDRICVYSLLGSTWEDSLAEVRDGRLLVRPSYRAFILLAKLLARLEGLGIVEDGEMVHVAGNRNDGIGFSIVWSRVAGRNLSVPVPRGARIFTALGDEVKEGDGSQITLWPTTHPALAGPARIIISRRW
jgi:hypothetical protein